MEDKNKSFFSTLSKELGKIVVMKVKIHDRKITIQNPSLKVKKVTIKTQSIPYKLVNECI